MDFGFRKIKNEFLEVPLYALSVLGASGFRETG
jgi:hypothetical protein